MLKPPRKCFWGHPAYQKKRVAMAGWNKEPQLRKIQLEANLRGIQM